MKENSKVIIVFSNQNKEDYIVQSACTTYTDTQYTIIHLYKLWMAI